MANVKSNQKPHAAPRGIRGPSIARKTAEGKPTAYCVMKELWSGRGRVINKVPDIGDTGEVKKSSVIGILKDLDKEAAAPFKIKKVGPDLHLIAA